MWGRIFSMPAKPGDGQMAKICNNLMLGILMSGTCEALSLGIDNGLDPKVLSDIMLQSSGRNWALELYNPCPGVMESVPANNAYQPGFMSKLMQKDLGLGMDAALHSQSAIPMGTLARNLYAFHNARGNELLDFSSMFEFTAIKISAERFTWGETAHGFEAMCNRYYGSWTGTGSNDGCNAGTSRSRACAH